MKYILTLAFCLLVYLWISRDNSRNNNESTYSRPITRRKRQNKHHKQGRKYPVHNSQQPK